VTEIRDVVLTTVRIPPRDELFDLSQLPDFADACSKGSYGMDAAPLSIKTTTPLF